MKHAITLSLTDRAILASYDSVLDGLSAFFGDGIEFVLHSLEDLDHSAIKIINGHYSNRKVGAPITNLALELLQKINLNKHDNPNMIYQNQSKNGSPIKAATFPIFGENKKIITLCHGPAALISGNIDESEFLFKNYEMTVFPDSIDEGANQEIGYMPGKLKWLLAEKLESLGAKIVNEAISGQVHIDRNLITGDSPLAANQLGIVAVDELLKMVNK